MVEITVNFYIEAAGNDKKAVETSISEIAEKLRGENVQILELNIEDPVETDDPKARYSAMMEAKIRGELGEIVNLILRYGPTIVELEDMKEREIRADELVKILALVSKVMGELMEKFGPLAIYPDLSNVPEPRIGYSEDEIAKMIIDEGMIRYQFVIEVFGKDKDSVESSIKKALAIEGCYINKIASKVLKEENINSEKRVKVLIALELLSNFEVLFNLTAKYSPVAIVMLEPEFVDINPTELQNALSGLATLVNELIHRPLLIANQ
ncbi:hypothetical protein [Pyrococcus abyssi]|uniref:Uncharacterized protein n=1 Tax=Pyrococcus abyssi (strain GE5 / Orsay) TaxID=272844 RepID=Q9V0N2_PYRAB|nr:hypothetical protein [Pyrococcus abyssi]CAB49671.1 Hypothetical protein PAB1860 [Pyrococcus abyssi GE5]CCE70153.1 TPA: hypothetical protein PAB1860 [Pyrococcus abyssi GE5]